MIGKPWNKLWYEYKSSWKAEMLDVKVSESIKDFLYTKKIYIERESGLSMSCGAGMKINCLNEYEILKLISDDKLERFV